MAARLIFQNRVLFFAVLASAGLLGLAALGPGLFGSTAVFNSWQYQIFDSICHQDPFRSYYLSGVQMAVCSRCLGIYGMFFIGWLMLPAFAVLTSGSTQKEKNWLIAAIILNLVDVLGNYFGIWTNSMTSRLVLGGLLSLGIVILLADEFFTINKSE
ncbi:MAG: hypothetical protein CL666_01880 [Balneola sp.]|nr:hypothetical protein [Balneola sp.]|tara:strand:+ start:10165 stop:10635 length:471 start_codon:yes stop_codon:yes gene_type:complete